MLIFSAVVLLIAGGFIVARTFGAGRILGEVQAVGVEIGGMDQAEAEAALAAAEAELASRPIIFEVVGQKAVLQGSQVGFDTDTVAMVDEAIMIGRQRGIPEQFRWWLGHFGETAMVEVDATINPAALEEVLAGWDADLVRDPPFPGGVEMDGISPVAHYPEDGRQIDRSRAEDLVLANLIDLTPEPVELPVIAIPSTVSPATVDAALEQAVRWLAAPVVLTATGEMSITFQPSELAAGLRSQAAGDRILLSFAPEAVEPVLDANRADVEQPPVDAEFEIDGYEVNIIPGSNGTLIDPEATATALAEAADSADRTGPLPFVEGAEPEVTTADLEALGIEHLVSQFTTYHSCCQNRVTNIHLIAETVEGAILAPGESFGLNEFVGPRTTEAGYLEDGTIVRGELVATVGGGVSQFATTFYNAVFWGGYEDVTHKPHSFYFSRYPEGIEATISWPQPELAFRNDSGAGVLIMTEYTGESITIMLFGSNDGRIVAGAHREGDTDIEVVAEGGSSARRISAELSDRFAFTNPPSPELRPNPSFEVDEVDQVQEPDEGWSVTVTRTIEVGGDPTTQEWTVIYSPQREILEVHPCQVPGSGIPCPEETTTTTTTPTTTTTTTPPTTTTP